MSVDSFLGIVGLAIDIIHEMGGQCSFYIQKVKISHKYKVFKRL